MRGSNLYDTILAKSPKYGSELCHNSHVTNVIYAKSATGRLVPEKNARGTESLSHTKFYILIMLMIIVVVISESVMVVVCHELTS